MTLSDVIGVIKDHPWIIALIVMFLCIMGMSGSIWYLKHTYIETLSKERKQIIEQFEADYENRMQSIIKTANEIRDVNEAMNEELKKKQATIDRLKRSYTENKKPENVNELTERFRRLGINATVIN